MKKYELILARCFFFWFLSWFRKRYYFIKNPTEEEEGKQKEDEAIEEELELNNQRTNQMETNYQHLVFLTEWSISFHTHDLFIS
jgi:hypothetical protein